MAPLPLLQPRLCACFATAPLTAAMTGRAAMEWTAALVAPLAEACPGVTTGRCADAAVHGAAYFTRRPLTRASVLLGEGSELALFVN